MQKCCSLQGWVRKRKRDLDRPKKNTGNKVCLDLFKQRELIIAYKTANLFALKFRFLPYHTITWEGSSQWIPQLERLWQIVEHIIKQSVSTLKTMWWLPEVSTDFSRFARLTLSHFLIRWLHQQIVAMLYSEASEKVPHNILINGTPKSVMDGMTITLIHHGSKTYAYQWFLIKLEWNTE